MLAKIWVYIFSFYSFNLRREDSGNGRRCDDWYDETGKSLSRVFQRLFCSLLASTIFTLNSYEFWPEIVSLICLKWKSCRIENAKMQTSALKLSSFVAFYAIEFVVIKIEIKTVKCLANTNFVSWIIKHENKMKVAPAKVHFTHFIHTNFEMISPNLVLVCWRSTHTRARSRCQTEDDRDTMLSMLCDLLWLIHWQLK